MTPVHVIHAFICFYVANITCTCIFTDLEITNEGLMIEENPHNKSSINLSLITEKSKGEKLIIKIIIIKIILFL